MAKILFIGEQYLKDKTPLGKNIDVEMIVPQIEYSQDAYIQNILGEKFYSSLQDSYSAQTLNQYETELVALIKPALAYRSAETTIPFIHIQLKNKGTLNLDAESGRQSSIQDAKYLIEILKGRAEFYEQRIQDYLVNNGNQFPDYTSPNIGAGIYPDSKSTYTCDLYFKDYTRPYNDKLDCGCMVGNCNCLNGYY